MRKTKVLSILITFIIIFSVGCNTKNVSPQPNEEANKTIRIGYIAMLAGSPQALINREKRVFEEAFVKEGYDIEWVLASGRGMVVPMMEEGKFDFLYSPLGNAIAYFTEKSAFGGGDNYRIIAGSTTRPDSMLLIAGPGIDNVADLENKTIGIPNDSFQEEFLLNFHLRRVGLATEIMGGNVKIVYQDNATELHDMFERGEVDAVIARRVFESKLLELVPNSTTLITLRKGIEEEIGVADFPHTVLKARVDLIETKPELVQLMINTHISATNVAKENIEMIQTIAGEVDTYFNTVVRQVKDFEPATVDEVRREWANTRITYDPVESFLIKIHSFLIEAGYTDKGYDKLVNFTALGYALNK